MGNLIRQTWQEVRYDFRNAHWNGALLWKITLLLPILTWMIGLPFLVAVLVLLQRLTGDSRVACTPDGQFNLSPERYSYWSRTGFFQISLAFGNLSFENAKLVDVVWDVTVGRGGQALLAFFSWHVFALYVTTSMETTPVTYRSYRAMFLETGPSFWTTLLLVRDFLWRKGLDSKIAMMFMVTTMAFTLCFPTFASAMTGYTSFVKAYIQDNQDNWVDFEKFSQVIYTIHDGDRIGQTSPYYVTDKRTNEDPILTDAPAMLDCTLPRWGPFGWPDDANDDWNATYITSVSYYKRYLTSDCQMQNNISEYVKQYGLGEISQSASVFMTYNLDAPTLNISASYFYDPSLYGSANFSTEEQKQSVWARAGETYDYGYVSEKGRCQPVGKRYQWGFSLVQLLSMNVMLMIWTYGIVTMWWHAQATMQKRGRAAVAGMHKAVIELAAAMSKELNLQGLNDELPQESQFKKDIHAIQGGRVSYSNLLLTEKQLPNTSLRRWLVQDMWWIVATIVLVGLSSSIWLLNILVCLSILGPTVGLLLALCIGTTRKSRMALILVCAILGLIPVIIMSFIFLGITGRGQ